MRRWSLLGLVTRLVHKLVMDLVYRSISDYKAFHVRSISGWFYENFSTARLRIKHRKDKMSMKNTET